MSIGVVVVQESLTRCIFISRRSVVVKMTDWNGIVSWKSWQFSFPYRTSPHTDSCCPGRKWRWFKLIVVIVGHLWRSPKCQPASQQPPGELFRTRTAGLIPHHQQRGISSKNSRAADTLLISHSVADKRRPNRYCCCCSQLRHFQFALHTEQENHLRYTLFPFYFLKRSRRDKVQQQLTGLSPARRPEYVQRAVVTCRADCCLSCIDHAATRMTRKCTSVTAGVVGCRRRRVVYMRIEISKWTCHYQVHGTAHFTQLKWETLLI